MLVTAMLQTLMARELTNKVAAASSLIAMLTTEGWFKCPNKW